ncbi:MAG: iron ABC transporter permease [Halomonadaceae bacterium]|nr:MAG: iron ABC transporter permease [Halomonadaceae bacterium]
MPWLLLSLLLTCVVLAGLRYGATPMSWLGVISALVDGLPGVNLNYHSTQEALVVRELRLPRVLMGGLIGAGLAVAGASVQAVFRNPLADPGIIGVSSGSALAAILMIVMGDRMLIGWLADYRAFALPIAAFIGGLITTALIYRISTMDGATRILTLLLAGIAISALTGALSGILTYLADDQQLRTLTFWSMGSLGGLSWQSLWTAGPWILTALVVLPFFCQPLNALLMGEQVAGHLGMDAQRIKKVVLTLAAVAVGASVAVAGIIGFVGLVVPHLMRLWLGPDHRRLLPACALCGASLLILADLLSRTIAAPAEIPIGIITALIGSPFFLWLLLTQGKRGGIS